MFHVKQKRENKYDIIVVGAGHAGLEAAIVSARLGMKTALVTLDRKKIALMSCNPAIGGLAKGQLVKEIDALGGVMGRITDEAGIHFKMLNISKGPAVQSPRAQADRKYYAVVAGRYAENTKNLTVIEEMAVGVIVDHNKISGVRLKNGAALSCDAAIITAGTFLNGIIYIGMKKLGAGRAGDLPAQGMTESLEQLGFRSARLKTGTPPRVHKDSIDYSKTEIQRPDEKPVPFSYATEKITRRQINCYIVHTNEQTHDILRLGFDRSPLFLGTIKGVGPRYCPSIEDKINRFADKPRHQLFLEPEGYDNEEIYVNGFSTSLPIDIQERSIHSIPGLEKAKIIRLGYAVEYDFFPPSQINHTLETKGVDNLYFAGQINGTSGYEEAAAQGLVAGINAALKLKNREPFVLSRSEAYIGVLIDDLINKTHDEPYRMFTSRAEFRLTLRQDNADLRLMGKGRNLGLIEDRVYEQYLRKKEEIALIEKRVLGKAVEPAVFNTYFAKKSSALKQSQKIATLLRRPELKLNELIPLVTKKEYSTPAINEVEFNTKYEGYLRRQQEQIEKFKKLENKKIPESLDYLEIKAMSVEAREKLSRIRPENLGQASRISGVSPADLSVLVIYLEKNKIMDVSRET